MSKEIKMSEVFPYAFQVEHNKSFEVQDATWYSYGSKYESDCDQDSAIAHAVLNHDRLVEEIAQLKKDNEELREFVCSLQLDVSNEIKLEKLLEKLNK